MLLTEMFRDFKPGVLDRSRLHPGNAVSLRHAGYLERHALSRVASWDLGQIQEVLGEHRLMLSYKRFFVPGMCVVGCLRLAAACCGIFSGCHTTQQDITGSMVRNLLYFNGKWRALFQLFLGIIIKPHKTTVSSSRFFFTVLELLLRFEMIRQMAAAKIDDPNDVSQRLKHRIGRWLQRFNHQRY